MPVTDADRWTDGEWNYCEIIRQPLGNGKAFSAGLVEDHPVERLYFRYELPPSDYRMLLLTLDEAAAIAWCMSGALWSALLADRVDEAGLGE